MALTTDETGMRTEMPTPLRLVEARRSGHVARSSDLVSVAVLTGGLAGLALFGGPLLSALRDMMADTLASAGKVGTLELPSGTAAVGMAPVWHACLPILVLPMLAAVIANLVQVGFLLSLDPIKPDLRRIWPAGSRRSLVSLRHLVKGLLGLAKIGVVVGMSLVAAKGMFGRIVGMVGAPADRLAPGIGRMSISLGARLLGALFVLAVIDWLYQRWQYKQDLKITRRQLADDMRRAQGDRRITRKRIKAATAQRHTKDLQDRKENA